MPRRIRRFTAPSRGEETGSSAASPGRPTRRPHALSVSSLLAALHGLELDLSHALLTGENLGLREEIEGLGVVLLEAAAVGKPSVTGRSGGTPEAVLDDVTGFVVDATDRQALVDALALLLTDREKANTMGIAGRHHVEENFSSKIPPKALVEWLD